MNHMCTLASATLKTYDITNTLKSLVYLEDFVVILNFACVTVFLHGFSTCVHILSQNTAYKYLCIYFIFLLIKFGWFSVFCNYKQCWQILGHYLKRLAFSTFALLSHSKIPDSLYVSPSSSTLHVS